MKYRMLDANNDYTFGQNGMNFYANVPAAVAQAIQTRLGLIMGEWFLDNTVGTPYDQKIMGMGRKATFDQAIKEVITNTPGFDSFVNYSSNVNAATRAASVSCTINSIYGQVSIIIPYAFSSSGVPALLDVNFVLDQSILG